MRKLTQEKIRSALDNHQLPNTYEDDVVSFMLPIAKQLYKQQKEQPLIVGIQGSQGSGKSTSAAFLKLLLECEFGLSVEVCSIDDFYLSRAERQALAENIHPLLQTRGVPGTHHTDSISRQFTLFRSRKNLTLPQFDKSTDDPKPKTDWLTTDKPANILILEGWCVGLKPQTKECLKTAVNELEKTEDPKGIWREYVNQKLVNEYSDIFKQLNELIVLQAPSFDCVFEWRQLQEQKLIKLLKAQNKSTDLTLGPAQIKRFIEHYQRLTEHAINTLEEHASFILKLNADHRITSLKSTYNEASS